jgi:F0F1-type ATP synthase membrane subunit c/vacuolar-type H+-ATPase subunit K
VASRAALVVALAGCPVHAESPRWEAPAAGLVVGLEVGVLVNAIAEGRTAASWAWCLGAGAAAGIGGGAYLGTLRAEPDAPLALRATAIGLAIPAAVLLWGRIAEAPSAEASEDSSALASRSGVVLPQKTQ